MGGDGSIGGGSGNGGAEGGTGGLGGLGGTWRVSWTTHRSACGATCKPVHHPCARHTRKR
jgi:hypothetical protein